ncbi:uncharacterized protein A1O9_03307 [Exophiala aquamarina CBS 119918]|uniref:Uncharacterized protein n=1 Tax=Exophiala aquamarina CBS 119918 TaxID=1182545 RepID=A0A072PPS6_9EURO|nr:uncharacterized protein A1O9_03307 [Exophiala aquamarina CBS 119918]KEF61737.1 hypothetical protein A1O9_03307 [Exophiala aquamarina CBS 119918]
MASHPYGETISQLLSPSTHLLLFSLPTSPQKPVLPASTISRLSLHPVLESILHILNYDLPSAHFLLRHMQAPPAYEAMFLHGVLHRVEGDLENAAAWYVDVQDTEVFRVVWGVSGENGGDGDGAEDDGGAQGYPGPRESVASKSGSKNPSRTAADHTLLFLDSLVEAKASVRSGQAAPQYLVQASLGEFSRLWDFCETKFGTEPVLEASDIWVSMAEKNASIAEKMITGGEGWREF